MTVLIALLVIIVALGVATVLGHTADSRDSSQSLGRIIDPPRPTR